MSPGNGDESAAEAVDPAPDNSELLAFLFADVRGYTQFTARHGDEAAGRLAAKFAAVVHEVVPGFDGTVFELRGDEAVCVFASPRRALRCGLALQQRFVAETEVAPDLPLAVGIGVDAGEAVRGEHGYRGGALNTAARLCAHAKAGDVLATPEVTHMAGEIDGVRYVALGRITLKGLSAPVRPTRVLPADDDPAHRMAALLAADQPPATRFRRVRFVAAAVAVVTVIAAATTAFVIMHDSSATPLRAFAENSLGVIDPASGQLIAQVGVGANPTAVATGYGSVWTANLDANTVTRVDISSRRVVTEISVGSAPSAIAVGLGSVWVVNSASGTVDRIDPSDYSVQSIPVGAGPRGIVLARGSAWVTNSANGTVSRIDPNQNAVVQTIPVGTAPNGIAAGRDIWIANSADNTVTRIDGVTHLPSAPIAVGGEPRDVAVIGDGVWVTDSLDGRLARITTTGTSAIPVGPQPGHLAAVGADIWVTSQTSGQVVEVSQASHRVIRRVPVGVIPGGIVIAGGKLWVTATVDPARHRGGTLRILGDEIDSIDPTYLDDLQQQVLVANTGYDGLVGFAHESGADGAAIVPDLATTLPQPTAGGRVYTFGVRSRVRWSTGAPVTVFDIRRGLERAILAHDPIGTDIAGTANCKPSACLVSGIAVNPSASTVTITLARPNGNFLDDLATTVSVPASTPLAEHDDRLVPSTGPYQVTSFIPGKLVVLARNRYFHQWSAAAQPAGYPDRIEWRVAYHAGKISSQPAVDAVAAGRADWADARLAAPASASLGSRYTSLAARFGTRLHETPAETIHGLTLNTRIPPFNDVRARRAVAFAVDRAAVAAAWDIPGAVTCQIVPPNFSGYRPYCPYTLLQSGGRTDVWRAPNVIAAQRLVTQSHTRGMTVTIYKPPLHTGALPLIVDALRDIGYRPRVVGFRGDWPDYLNFVADSRRKVQLGFYGWVTGDATAANLLSNYRCDAYQPATTNILNPAGFCDPKFDHLLDEANRVEASSLAKADDLWAQADRILVDEAPWVPLVTPTWVDVVSARVHNYTRSPILGMLYDQMWVR